jgi:hypothetical protein
MVKLHGCNAVSHYTCTAPTAHHIKPHTGEVAWLQRSYALHMHSSDSAPHQMVKLHGCNAVTHYTCTAPTAHHIKPHTHAVKSSASDSLAATLVPAQRLATAGPRHARAALAAAGSARRISHEKFISRSD